MWVIKNLNFDLEMDGVGRKLQLSEFEESEPKPMRTLGGIRREQNCSMTSIFIGKSSS